MGKDAGTVCKKKIKKIMTIWTREEAAGTMEWGRIRQTSEKQKGQDRVTATCGERECKFEQLSRW